MVITSDEWSEWVMVITSYEWDEWVMVITSSSSIQYISNLKKRRHLTLYATTFKLDNMIT